MQGPGLIDLPWLFLCSFFPTWDLLLNALARSSLAQRQNSSPWFRWPRQNAWRSWSFSFLPEGKSLKDEDILQNLPVGTTATLYFRDLGAQISWVTVSMLPCIPREPPSCHSLVLLTFLLMLLAFQVFLTEYAGPLMIYLLFYFRVPFIYGPKYDFTSSKYSVVQ